MPTVPKFNLNDVVFIVNEHSIDPFKIESIHISNRNGVEYNGFQLDLNNDENSFSIYDVEECDLFKEEKEAKIEFIKRFIKDFKHSYENSAVSTYHKELFGKDLEIPTVE